MQAEYVGNLGKQDNDGNNGMSILLIYTLALALDLVVERSATNTSWPLHLVHFDVQIIWAIAVYILSISKISSKKILDNQTMLTLRAALFT